MENNNKSRWKKSCSVSCCILTLGLLSAPYKYTLTYVRAMIVCYCCCCFFLVLFVFVFRSSEARARGIHNIASSNVWSRQKTLNRYPVEDFALVCTCVYTQSIARHCLYGETIYLCTHIVYAAVCAMWVLDWSKLIGWVSSEMSAVSPIVCDLGERIACNHFLRFYMCIWLIRISNSYQSQSTEIFTSFF